MENLGEMLVAAGMLTEQQLKTAKNYQDSLGGTFSQIVTKLGFIDDKKLTQFVAENQALRQVDLDSMVIPLDLAKTVPKDIIEKHRVLPIKLKGDIITLAMSDPEDYAAIEAVQFVSGKRVVVNMASRESLNRAIQGFFDALAGDSDDPLLRQLSHDDHAHGHGGAGAGAVAASAAKKSTTKSDGGLTALRAKDAGMKDAKSGELRSIKNFDLFLPALIPLLIEKGIITEQDLRKKLNDLRGNK